MENSNSIEKYRDIWQNFLEGDDNALSLIYCDFFDFLLAFGLKYSVDRYLVEDCIQNLFVGMLKKRGEQTSVQNVRFYLLRGLKNQIAYEKRKNKNLVFKNDAGKTDLGINDPVESLIIDHEKDKLQIAFLKKVFESLTDRQREVLYLKYTCSLDYIQIADMMDISVESVRTLIYRTLKSLNETFGTDELGSMILCFLMRLFPDEVDAIMLK